MQTKYLCVLFHIWIKGEVGESYNRFKPSSKIFYWPFQGGTSFVDLLCFCSVLCLLCLCARLFICALWSPAGKGLTSWSRLWCLLWVCHFPIGILGQVWYLIVSIPDLCTLTYFDQIKKDVLSTISKVPLHYFISLLTIFARIQSNYP